MLRRAATAELAPPTLSQLRSLFDASFREFTDDDWAHGLGGTHLLVEDPDGTVVAHAAVVGRTLFTRDRPLRCGYVENVASLPSRRGDGAGDAVARAATDVVRDGGFDIGALSTGVHRFYERLGWQRWRGATFVVTADGTWQRTAEEDDGVMVLRTPSIVELALDVDLACDWRPGDVW